MDKEKKIEILFPSGVVSDCIVHYPDISPWKISVDCSGKHVFKSEADDLFEAFVEIRRQLRNNGFDLLCNGSRRNIYPSPMLRQSSGGRMAYLLRLGVPARREDVVDIFDTIKKSDMDTIEKQKAFYDLWLDSLEPTPKEIEEADKNPNGWVYRIDGIFSEDEEIPPTAIIGAWKVDSEGKITHNFTVNKNYMP